MIANTQAAMVTRSVVSLDAQKRTAPQLKENENSLHRELSGPEPREEASLPA